VHPSEFQFPAVVNGATSFETPKDVTGTWKGSASFPSRTFRVFSITLELMTPPGESRIGSGALRSIWRPARSED
jgi:hypothetical protein